MPNCLPDVICGTIKTKKEAMWASGDMRTGISLKLLELPNAKDKDRGTASLDFP